MSSLNGKPPVKDPTRPPTAVEVDAHLGPFSRYARTVRGAARVSGLSAKLAWSSQGWIEQLKMDESLIASIILTKSPTVAEVGISQKMEEALKARPLPEALKAAVSKAPGTAVKWVEFNLVGPEQAELAAALVTAKVELIRSGQVPLSQAEKLKAPPKPPEPEPVRALKPLPSAKPAPQPKVEAKPKPKAAVKLKPAAKTATKKAPKAAKPAKKPVKAKKK